MSEHKMTPVEETRLGIYVWEMPDGRWVGDDEGNYMNIPSMKGDKRRINMLREAARSYGIREGRPVFLSGQRRVTNEELENQTNRLEEGLIPDPYDLPALIEEYKEHNDDRIN